MSLRDPEARRRFLESVAAGLDELAEAEPPPPGLAPEVPSTSDPVPDLFSLLAQLAALTRETQLQGRATNRLHAELGAALERLAESISSPDAIAKKLVEARREARLELVAELLEVRDRFARGLEEARRRLAHLRGLRARLGQRPVLESLIEGDALALDRLDDALRRLDVHGDLSNRRCVLSPTAPRSARAPTTDWATCCSLNADSMTLSESTMQLCDWPRIMMRPRETRNSSCR